MTILLQPTIRAAEANERDRVVETITSAFAADPAARWMYPDPEQYRRFFPRLVEALGGRAIESGAAYCADGCSGADQHEERSALRTTWVRGIAVIQIGSSPSIFPMVRAPR